MRGFNTALSLIVAMNTRLALVRAVRLLAVWSGFWGFGDASTAGEPVTLVVSGRVIDSESRPLAGATVEVFDSKRRLEHRRLATTDADGRYELTIETDKKLVCLAASTDGFVVISKNLLARQNLVPLDFELAPIVGEQQSAFGKVVDQAGKPIAGARVEAFTPIIGFNSSFSHTTGRDFMPGPDRVAVTDHEGRFRIDNLSHAEVHLSLRASHRHVNDANHSVGVPLVIEMRGSGRPGVVRGRLVDAETGEAVTLDRSIRLVRRHTTKVHQGVDAQGRFELPVRATLGGRCSVYAYVAGYAAASERWAAVSLDSDEYHEIRLTRAPALRVRFVDATTSEPIAGVRALYALADDAHYFSWGEFDRHTDGYHSLSFVQHVTSGADGDVWFAEPVERSQPVLIGFADGYQRFMIGLDEDDPPRIDDRITVKLHRESALIGVITTGKAPAVNKGVQVAGQKLYDMEPRYPSWKTDARGRYRVGGLAPGSYRVWSNGCFRHVDVGPAETITLNMGADIGHCTLSGNAPPGASITLSPEFDWEYRSLVATVNDEGEYRLTGLKPGRYKVRMQKWANGFRQGRLRTEIVIERDKQHQDFQWRRAQPKPAPRPMIDA